MSIPNNLIATLRRETPGTQHVVHLNNAGASLVPFAVHESVKSYLDHELIHGGYESAAHFSSELDTTYDSIARLINARPQEIALVENATFAWHQAFFSYPWKKGDNLVTGYTEYASNYISFLKAKERFGIHIKVAGYDGTGSVDPEKIRNLVDGQTRMIVLTHIPTNNGVVNPAEEIGRVANEKGVLYLVDACQSVGQYPVDVEAIGCDMLSATGRKFLRGPRGTGFLYVRQEKLKEMEPLFLDLHGAEWTTPDTYKIREDAKRFENWESNKALILGLKAAADYALSIGMDSIWERVVSLANTLRSRLEQEITGLTMTDTGAIKSGIVTFSMERVASEELKQYLYKKNINVSVTHKSSSLLDMEGRNLEAVIRASVHYYNNDEDIDRLIQALISFK